VAVKRLFQQEVFSSGIYPRQASGRVIQSPTSGQYHAALKAVIKREIIVLDALGDSELRFQSISRILNLATADAGLAYWLQRNGASVCPDCSRDCPGRHHR
jgi:hypothetical protein